MTMTHVDGVEIVARQKAVGAPGSVGEGAEIQSVEQLLLADDRIVFHCVHKNAVNCEYTNAVMGGVMSHQRSHSDRMMAKRANEKVDELAAQLAEVEAEKARKKANYSAGAKKGQETRKTRQLQTPSEVGGVGNGHRVTRGEPSKSVVGDDDLAKQAQRVIIAFNAMQDATDEFQKVFIGYMRQAQICSERPEAVIDPQILAKARQYDIIQAALKGTAS